MTLDRRNLLGWTTALAVASSTGLRRAAAQQAAPQQGDPMARTAQMTRDFRKKMVGFMLAHEQFAVPDLLQIGAQASNAGFQLLATSDHFQPWQANQRHTGEA